MVGMARAATVGVVALVVRLAVGVAATTSHHHHRRGSGGGGGRNSDTGGGDLGCDNSGVGKHHRVTSGHSSGGGHGGREDRSRRRDNRYDTSSYFRSSHESSSDHHGVTVANKPRQVTPFLVDVASSAARISRRTVTDDCAKPVFSHLAHAHTAAIGTADAAAKARNDASVRHAYVPLGHKAVARSYALPFPAYVTKVDSAQHLVR